MTKRTPSRASSGFNSPAILSQPYSASIEATLLLNAGGVESAIDLGRELTIAEECGDPRTLRFRTAETEFPLVAGTFGDLLLAARLWVRQWNVVSLHLFRRQARPNPFTTHGNALLLQLRALFRGHLTLYLAEDQLQVGQVLVIDLHVA